MTLFRPHFSISIRRTTAFCGLAAAFACAVAGSAAANAPKNFQTEKPKMNENHIERDLKAGPIHLKFADGELRYLYVGNKEIVRRIYFAVRDGDWDTAPPQFDRISYKSQPNGFTIELSAHSVLPTADFRWTGKIVGTPDGKISFTASGEPGKDFKSNRIGLCVLYGAPSLAGQAYETVDMDGTTVKPGVFPLLVSAPLVVPHFQTLRYTTPSGLSVSTHLTGQAHIDMEDQRTYSDSSFKAYAPLAYNYAAPVKQGDRKEETITVSVSGTAPTAAPAAVAAKNAPYVVRVGGPVENATVPQIGQASAEEKNGVFGAVNGNAAQFANAQTLTWGYNPSLHLPDNDTFVENAVTILDQVKSAHSYAPGATIRISPLTFDNTHPRTNPRDPRNNEEFGALWSALMVKYMSLAGVSSAGFRVGDARAAAQAMQKELSTLSGKTVLDAVVEGGPGVFPLPVQAFAVKNENAVVLFVMNTSSKKEAVTVAAQPGTNGEKHELKPYEVLTLRFVP